MSAYKLGHASMFMAALMALGIAGPASAQVVTQTVDFQTFPGGAATTQSTSITNQYESVGFVITGAATRTIQDYGTSYGSSGRSVLINGDLDLVFSPPVSRVKFTLGHLNWMYAARAYNAQEVEVDSVLFPANLNFETFEVTGPGIVRVFLDGENNDGVVLDNIEFDQGAADSDGDGTPDDEEECDTDIAKLVPGVCGCNVAEVLTDSDGDQTPNCIDGCPNDMNKIAAGTCGCGTADSDEDGDGVLLCNDQCIGKDSVGDTDQDGICNDRDDRVIIVTEQFSDARGICEVGGVAITAGVDRDNSGTLDNQESYGTDYACTGPQGPEGRQVRFLSEVIEPGDERCPGGGVELKLGIDDNANGELDTTGPLTNGGPPPTEVDATHKICNGLKTVAALVPYDPDEFCRNGGVEFSIGIDDNGNGVLDTTGPLGNGPPPTEVDVSERICNGFNSVVNVTTLADPGPQSIDPEPGVSCPTGGIHVAAGTDSNGNAALDDSEIKVEQNVCHGLNSLVLTSELGPNTGGCPRGGYQVRAGVDADADGELSEGEQSSSQAICHGRDGIVSVATLGRDPAKCPSGGIEVGSGTDDNGNGMLEEAERDFLRPVCHGLGTLVVTTELAADPAVCPEGGSRIDAGVDKNGDGDLDADEISSTESVCDGLHSVVKTSPLAADPAVCARGGALVSTGTDADGDGTLDAGEISSTQTVCAGLSSLTRTSSVAANPEQCPFGGAKLESGSDKDGDGTLDDDEVSSTQILCGGTGLAVRTRRLEVGSDACPAGGLQLETGIDVDGDGMLDDAEVQNSDALCQPPALLFETETIAENNKRCPHGGLRVFSGHDDGDPEGTPGDGELQDEEIELDRDVCLAPTDVLVNGGTGQCTVTTLTGGSSPAHSLGLLLVAAVFAARRRRRAAERSRT